MKILILKNTKVSIEDDVLKVKEYFKDKISLDFEYKETYITCGVKDVVPYKELTGFDPKTGKLSKVKYYGLSDNFKTKYKHYTIYDIVVFAYDIFNIDGGVVTSFAEATPVGNIHFIQLAINEYTDKKGETWKKLSHEILHTLCYKANGIGIMVRDEMDMTADGYHFYKNDDPYALDGNYARTLKNLKPYFDSLKEKIVTIRRIKDTGKQTLGELSFTGWNCKTLELSYKDNKPNISCIPKGQYLVIWSFSPRFLKYTYEITKVPARSGIRIHSGNFFFQLNGCIMLGDSYSDINADGELDILNSRKKVKEFEDLMNRKSFILRII